MSTFNATLLAGGSPFVLRHTLAAPTALDSSVGGGPSVTLAWTDNSGGRATAFEVQRKTVNGANTWLTVATPAASPYTDEGVEDGGEYNWRVRATRGSVVGDWSSTVGEVVGGGPPPSDPSFSLTAVPDATVGITDDLAGWSHGSATWWPWTVRAVRFERTGNKALIVCNHSAYGARIYEGDGAFGFAEATASYGVVSTDFFDAIAGYLNCDLNHDGYGDLAQFGQDSQRNFYYDEADGSLDAQSAPWNFEGAPSPQVTRVGETAGTGTLEIEIQEWVSWPTALEWDRIVYTWTGSAWSESTTAGAPPSGIPAPVLAEMETYLDDGSSDPNKRFATFYFNTFDFNLDGTNDDLLVQYTNSYGGVQRGWYLENDGAGNYMDRTAAWGLPDTGLPLVARQVGFGRPFMEGSGTNDSHLHDLAGRERPDLFLSNNPGGGDYGHYRWNDTSDEYELLGSSPITARLGLDGPYPKRLYAVDLTNTGRLDLVLQRPRSGYCYVFLNDGSGDLAEYARPGGGDWRCWDADGLCIDDLDGDRLPELILGGDGGVDSGVTSASNARCLSVYENTTTSPGNAVGFLIRRAGRESTNYFGVGTKVEVFIAGASFAAAALIRRFYARPDGMELVFGVGGATTVDYRATWPDGTTTQATGVAVNQTITLTG